MKKILALLVFATVASSLTGCGCCRRLRDTICRGAYCGSSAPIVAPAPVPIPVQPAPVYTAPVSLSNDCGCGAPPVAFDAGCGYPGYPAGMQMTSFGGVPCDACSGGYTLPSSSGVIYDDPSYLSTPSTLGPIDPGPAPTN